MIAVAFISLSLLGISGWLIDSHLRAWRRARDSDELTEREKQFGLAMVRRRMLASSTIGATGAAIAVGPMVPPRPMTMTVYLAVLLGACSWIMLLALLDVWATRQHYRQLRSEQRTKQTQLAREIAAMRERSAVPTTAMNSTAALQASTEADG